MEPSLQEVIASAKASLKAAEDLGMQEPLKLNALFSKMARVAGTYPVPNLAVELCCKAALEITKEYGGENPSEERLSYLRRIAYCGYLPRLSAPDDIRDFIACVVHGMAVGNIPSAEGTRLLYGAQIAHSALPSPKRRKKRNKSAQNTPGNQPTTPTPPIT